jgi:hypothetical protein
MISQLCNQFEQQQALSPGRGHPLTYTQKVLLVFFLVMQCRRITRFKAQWRWLTTHPQDAKAIGFQSLPHRTTLLRRSKKLYAMLQQFIAFVGQWADPLDEALTTKTLYEDKSLFKAQGPVWHQKDRKEGRIPDGLRNLDTDATWGKSAYHGWVYGYGLHTTCSRQGFPALVQVETASVSESQVIDEKGPQIEPLAPQEIVGDDAYTKSSRIRRWAKQGIAFLVPALKWRASRPAQAYHQFLSQPENTALLAARKTAVEPLFDLVSQAVGTTNNHKQLSIKGLANVRTCLALGVLTVQIAMIMNNIWGMALHNISHMLSVFT